MWTVATIGIVYLVGYALRIVFEGRVARLVARTPAGWDDQLLAEVKRRIPLWSLLVGLHLALPRWPLAQPTLVLLDQVLSAIGVASVTFIAAAVLARLVVDYGARASVPVSGLSQNLARLGVTIVGALVIVRSFGYDITPMLTVLGVGGLTVALALQEPLSNLFAGLFVSLAGQIHIGDYIRLDGGAEGYVVDLNWRSTRLRQLADNVVEIPNSKLAQAVITNFSQPGLETMAVVECTVEVGHDADRIERVAIDVAHDVMQSAEGAVSSVSPAVRFSAFTDAGLRLVVAVRVSSFAEVAPVRHVLIKRLHQRFEREGIAFADVRGKAPVRAWAGDRPSA